MKKVSLLFLMSLFFFSAAAQESDSESGEKIGAAHVSNFRDWAVGINLGSNIMAGDLSTFNTNRDVFYHGFDFAFGVHATKYLSSVWGIKGQFTYGSISGGNGYEAGNADGITAIRFENSPYFDYNASVVMNLSALAMSGKKKERKFAILVSAGLGMTQSQQTRLVDDVEDAVYAQGVADPDNQWTNEVFIPADLLLKWCLTPALDFDLGMQMKYNLSDIIDALPAGTSNDIVYYPHVGLTFNFGHEDKERKSVIYSNPLDDMYFDVAEVKEDMDELTTDDDGDGISNFYDEDNETPEGVAVDSHGNPMDSDGDGIPDYMDEDPFTQKGAQVDAQGRAIDSDGDGVPDAQDKEPNTPKGTMVNFQGVDISKNVGGGTYLPSVYFNFNSADVTAANDERLATIALALKNNPDLKLHLVGHADNRGPEQYNEKLARRRAESVKEKLVKVFGVDGARISVDSVGKGDPLAKPGENYKLNRRVDVSVQE